MSDQPHLSEAGHADWARRRQLGIAMDLNEAFPLPNGLYFDIGDEDDPDPVLAGALRAATCTDIARAFGLKPWHVGLAPVPWRVRLWRKITLARWRARRRIGPEV